MPEYMVYIAYTHRLDFFCLDSTMRESKRGPEVCLSYTVKL